jgi:outer membrane protein assembly factor BamA
MTKIRHPISSVIFLSFFMSMYSFAKSQNNYELHIKAVDKDSVFLVNRVGLQTSFISRSATIDYINKLPSLLLAKGYVTSSLDSIQYDSSFARVVLFVGDEYQWLRLDTSRVDRSILEGIGWKEKIFAGKPMDIVQMHLWQERILNYLENNGYPFAKVYVDSLRIVDEKVSGILKVEKGPLYKIDSIRVFGNVNVSNNFLQRYLEIENGSVYNKQKLQRISKRIGELLYIEEERPSNLTLLGTGSVLNLYLKPKRSSQFNVLLGFLPNNDQLSSKKLLVTGEADIHLRNALGSGETIGLVWQQIQVKSPRLNIIYQQPYLFNSPVGLDFAFDMFRKDSTFLNVNLMLGAQYALSANKTGKLFVQRFQTIVSGINENFVLQNRRLPDEADVSSFNVGLDYEFYNTNYRFNPRKGNEFNVNASVGTKKLKKNNEILQLKDPGDPSFDFESLYDTVKLKTYQFRIKIGAAKYFPWGKQSTVKIGVNTGIFQSGNIFRNELFQIGGYKLLRGFDEESQYVSQYAVGTLEYRYLIGQNSFFYVFTDGGWGHNNSQNTKANHTYFGAGLGLAFETKVGIFNLALAEGKRDDLPFNLRQSKVHFGFVNYF